MRAAGLSQYKLYEVLGEVDGRCFILSYDNEDSSTPILTDHSKVSKPYFRPFEYSFNHESWLYKRVLKLLEITNVVDISKSRTAIDIYLTADIEYEREPVEPSSRRPAQKRRPRTIVGLLRRKMYRFSTVPIEAYHWPACSVIVIHICENMGPD